MKPRNGSPEHLRFETPSRWPRRGLLLGGGAVLVLGGWAVGHWFNLAATGGEGTLDAAAAYDRLQAGTLTLVDIRRPEEWALTGMPQGSLALDMRRPDFAEALLAAVQGDTDAPVALICARGVRSRGMAARLAKAGFTGVLDVPEGMLGSGAGPGWIRRGLPVVAP